MIDSEMLNRLAVLIAPDTANNDLLLYLLEQAEGIILNKRYPFGAPEGVELSAAHKQVMLRVAVELFNKMGAEGQIAHDENGIKRTWEAADVSPGLLRQIVPVCGSVM